MGSNDQRRVEVLVIRAWSEADEFHARITRMQPLQGNDEESVLVASPEATLGEVHDWLTALTGTEPR